jgi:hypothetical protein
VARRGKIRSRGDKKTALDTWEQDARNNCLLRATREYPGEARYCGEAQAEAIALKGLDIMDTQTLLIIIILVLLLGGGGWYGRGRWF